MARQLPLWRSSLFVPVNIDRFVEKAHERDADAIVLDLEDSIAATEKAAARDLIGDAARKVSRRGADVIVRVNRSWRMVIKDLESATLGEVDAIMVPKVADAAHMRSIGEVLDELEQERGIPAGRIGLIAEIETAEGLFHAREIAGACGRMISVFLGSEDFAFSMRMEPEEEGLFYPAQHVAIAARSAGLVPLGFIGSIADYTDLDAFRRMVHRSRRLGFRGAFCIHPDQVPILNEEFTPTADEARRARGIIEAYDSAVAEGRGAATFEGAMIDPPVIERARETLAVRDRIMEQERRAAQN